jgi:hypothetical protein
LQPLITYSNKNKDISITLSLFGGNPNDNYRLGNIAMLTIFLQELGLMSASIKKLQPHAITITLDKIKEITSFLKDVINEFINLANHHDPTFPRLSNKIPLDSLRKMSVESKKFDSLGDNAFLLTCDYFIKNKLLSDIHEKSVIYDIIITTFIRNFNSLKDGTLWLDLWENCSTDKQWLETVYQKAAESAHSQHVIIALYLFKFLVNDDDQYVLEAYKLATEAFKNQNKELIDAALDVFNAISLKDKAPHDKLASIAFEAIKSHDETTRIKAKDLFTNLHAINKNSAMTKVKELEEIRKPNDEIKNIIVLYEE